MSFLDPQNNGLPIQSFSIILLLLYFLHHSCLYYFFLLNYLCASCSPSLLTKIKFLNIRDPSICCCSPYPSALNSEHVVQEQVLKICLRSKSTGCVTYWLLNTWEVKGHNIPFFSSHYLIVWDPPLWNLNPAQPGIFFYSTVCDSHSSYVSLITLRATLFHLLACSNQGKYVSLILNSVLHIHWRLS